MNGLLCVYLVILFAEANLIDCVLHQRMLRPLFFLPVLI